MYNNKQLKELKSWVDRFFVNYSFYLNKKLDFKDFLRKVNTQEI